jgi:DNA-binding ferritin-like protein (Dps family)
MSDANNIRRYLTLMEASEPTYVGPKASADISYQADSTGGKLTKVTAFLSSHDSGRYTKLGRNLQKVEALEKEIKQLKEETKQESRELVADLFNAEDAVATRVVDTVSFVFELSKDPKETETFKYAKILEELQSSLTPELLTMLETLKAKHRSTVQKAPSLKTTDKAVATEEGINEGVGDQLKGFFSKLLSQVKKWGAGYDKKLAGLKAQVGLGESISEDAGAPKFQNGDEVLINAPRSEGHGHIAHVSSFENGEYKVYLAGTGFHGFYDESELELV